MNLNDLKECAECGRIKYQSEFFQQGLSSEKRRDDMCKICRNHRCKAEREERQAAKK